MLDKPIILRKETYLKMIENAVGTTMFNSLFVMESGEKKDLLGNGELCCAVFVSSLLQLNGLFPKPKAMVAGLERDLLAMENFDQISPTNYVPESGDVVVWEKIKYTSGDEHRHIGFVLNNQEAVSTDYIEKRVVKHDLFRNTENPDTPRKIERIFRYKF